MDHGRVIFCTAITSADFQIEGINPSRMDALKIDANGSHRYVAKLRRNQFGRPSGPGWSFEDIYGSHAICNLYGISDKIRTVVIIKVS